MSSIWEIPHTVNFDSFFIIIWTFLESDVDNAGFRIDNPASVFVVDPAGFCIKNMNFFAESFNGLGDLGFGHRDFPEAKAAGKNRFFF